MKNKLLALASLAVISFQFALATASAQRPAEPSIVEIASSNPAFSTLVAAVVKAELVGTLDGRRQFTVFAPTNDAFDEAAEAVLGEGSSGLDLVELLDPDTLRDILLYHVSPGARFSESVLGAKRLRMMNKDFVLREGLTLVGNETSANLIPELIDIPARNGVVHIIDFVLLP